MSIKDKLLQEYVCKVYKNKERKDDRTLLCGSHVMKDRGGEYFLVPAVHADYISKIFPQYDVGEPFIPKKGNAKAADES